MTETRYDVLGVGNAIVDVIAHATDQFLIDNGIEKAAMTLIDEDRAKALYAAMGEGVEISGGSGANTLAGVASFGGRGAYIGKVAADQLGDIFEHDIRAIGVDYDTPRLKNGAATARCLINVTPDAQRSMCTFLGASTFFSDDDLDAGRIKAAEITYLEGYLFDREEAKKAFVRAAEIAKAAGRRVSLTLSDSFCVDRHRASFRQLVDNHIDILFANEAELKSLYETDDFVVKPVVGAGGWRQARIRRGEPLPAAGELPPAEAMIQPFLPAVAQEGEYSFLFFGGDFSHAALKRPREGDYRVQSVYGGREERHAPSPEDVALARETLAAACRICGQESPLYARVDMARGPDGRLALMELELIEPYLYPEQGPGMGTRFASALKARLG